MNQLLPEVLHQIFLHLDPSERLEKALTCRKWAELVSHGTLLEDTWLKIYGSEIDKAADILIRSQRHYRNLWIFGADLTRFNPEFWSVIGRHLHRLEIIRCNLPADVFYKIVRSTPELRYLRLEGTGGNRPGIGDLKPDETVCFPEIRESLRNVKKLVLKYLDVEALDHLFELMPNVTYFKGDIDADNRAFRGILRARNVFTVLRLRSLVPTDDELIELLNLHSETLRELRLDFICTKLTYKSLSAISKCTKLRCLSLAKCCWDLRDPELEKIIRNAPELESLNLGEGRLTEVSLARVTDLRKLRRFTFAGGRSFNNDAISVLGKLTSLRSLRLIDTEIDIGWVKNMAGLTHLQELTLWGNTKSVTPECFNTICDNFPGLELIWLKKCELLTDDVGKKFCSFKRLKSLKLWDAEALTDVAFEEGFGPPSLECLDLTFCDLTDVALNSLAVHHDNLRELSLKAADNITDAGMLILLRRQNHLIELNLSQCESLTGEFLIELADMCPRLQLLHPGDFYTEGCEELETFRRLRPEVDLW